MAYFEAIHKFPILRESFERITDRREPSSGRAYRGGSLRSAVAMPARGSPFVVSEIMTTTLMESLHAARNTRCVVCALAGAILLSACDSAVDSTSNFLWGTERKLVVISDKPMKISSNPVQFELAQPAAVVGSVAMVCMSLGDNIEPTKEETMSARFRTLMHGAMVKVVLTTTTGTKVELGQPMQAWSREGKIKKVNEMSACMSPVGQQDTWAVGTKIVRVDISSAPPLDIHGVYWESTNIADKILAGKKP